MAIGQFVASVRDVTAAGARERPRTRACNGARVDSLEAASALDDAATKTGIAATTIETTKRLKKL